MKNLVRFDWAMKKLLRSKANFGILEGFLSELLKRDLKILQLLESESNKDEPDDKQNRVDILAQLENNEIVLIEVQVDTQYNYFQRMLYGTSKIVTQYLLEGDPYDKIKKVYSVNILYFDLGHGKDYIYHGTTRFIGLHEQDELDLNAKQKMLYQKDFIHEIYPEYYLVKVNQFNNLAKTSLDEWIYFLKNEEIKENFHAKGLREALDKLNTMKLSHTEKHNYEVYLDNLRYQASMFSSNYGSGFIDGEKKGIKEGEAVGVEKGKLEVARNMQKIGITADIIRQTTGLAEEEYS